MKSQSLFLMSLVFCAMVSGCKSVDSVIEENRSWAEGKLSAIEKIHKIALTYPPALKSSGKKLVPPAVFTTENFSQRVEGWNGAIAFIDELKDYSVKSPNGMNITYNHFWFRGSSCLIRTGLWLNGFKLEYVKTAEDCLRELKQLNYLLVLRVNTIIPREIGGEAFVAGRTTGDALLFNIETSQVEGQFPISVKTSKRVNVRSEKAAYDLRSDLGKNFTKVLDEEIIKNFPGAKPFVKPFKFK